MHSSGAVKKIKSQEQQVHQREAEMKIVEQARAESRQEVAVLEQMKQRARAAFLSGDALTEEDFEPCWPQLRNQIFRQGTHYR